MISLPDLVLVPDTNVTDSLSCYYGLEAIEVVSVTDILLLW